MNNCYTLGQTSLVRENQCLPSVIAVQQNLQIQYFEFAVAKYWSKSAYFDQIKSKYVVSI